MLCIMLPVILMVSSYAINVAYMEHVRTDLQIATDVATRAAGRMLAVTGDQNVARRTAEDMLALNPIVNHTVSLDELNIDFGVSTRYTEQERYRFEPHGKNPNAIHIHGNGSLLLKPLFPTMGVPIKIRPVKTAISTQTELDVALVMDRSGSMAFSAVQSSGPHTPPNAPPDWQFGDPVPPHARWLDACVSVSLFLDLLNETSHNESVGLCTYGSDAKIDQRLTSDYSLVNLRMHAISQQYKGGATNIGDAIESGIETLAHKQTARPWATRVIILLTDGIHNTGKNPEAAAQTAAAQGIQIFTVSFSSEADIGRMSEIAAIASGKHFHADSADDLRRAFGDIAKSLPTLITH